MSASSDIPPAAAVASPTLLLPDGSPAGTGYFWARLYPGDDAELIHLTGDTTLQTWNATFALSKFPKLRLLSRVVPPEGHSDVE